MARQYRVHSHIDGTVTSHATADEALAAGRAYANAVVADPRAYAAAALAAGDHVAAAELAKYDLGGTEEGEDLDNTFIWGTWADGTEDLFPIAIVDELGRD